MNACRAAASDRAEIRAIVDGCIIWRDLGQSQRLLAAWHPDGRMSSTRFEGGAAEFVAQTARAQANGARVRHTQSGFWCELRGDRAFSVTGMAILQRAQINGIDVDVTTHGSFVDFFSYRHGRWALDRRQPAYDRDRIDPVCSGDTVSIEAAELANFPEAYRHLAYVQANLGMSINLKLPEMRGPRFEALMAEAFSWLDVAGAPALEAILPLRRSIGVEDANGRSGVRMGECPLLPRSPVPGLRTTLIWATHARIDYRTDIDDIPVPLGIAPPRGGSRFTVLDIAPGHHSAHLHHTNTLDYVICLSGSIDMLLYTGPVTLEAGDIVIQCGTNHGWANCSHVFSRVAIVLLHAQPKRRASIAGNAAAPS